MGFNDKFYANAPVTFQNLAISMFGFHWKNRRFNGIFKHELGKFKERENYTHQLWNDYQILELRKILLHAFDTVPFYFEKYKASGIKRTHLEKFELHDIKKLPYLEKEELRKFGKTTLVSRNPEKGGNFFSSSGSTGTPTSILYSIPFHQRWSAAFEARIRHWANVSRFDPRGMIGGRRVIPQADASPPYYRYNFFEKQTYFSAYHISRKTAKNYLEGIIKNKVSYMTGYAMSNFFLANTFDELGLEAPPLKAVITSSEKLTKEMRSKFREVYNCKTFDSYSGVEACGLISETKDGEFLVSPDVGIMEFIDENGNDIKPGQSGEVISTGLLNFDQPLIRYRIGDRVRLANKQSTASGLEMPVIEEIEGRVEDKVVGKDGREMVRFHGLYINVPHLIAAQIIQNDYDDFTFNVVVEDGFSDREEQIISQRLRSQIGEASIRFNRLQEIPQNNNGKFQAVISKLNQS